MSAGRRLTIEALADADLLCRLLGLFAQRDLAAPEMAVAVAGPQMTVTLHLAGLDPHDTSLVAEKMARCIGVAAVTIDGVPLAGQPPCPAFSPRAACA